MVVIFARSTISGVCECCVCVCDRVFVCVDAIFIYCGGPKRQRGVGSEIILVDHFIIRTLLIILYFGICIISGFCPFENLI